MGNDNVISGARSHDYEAQYGLTKEESVVADDAMLVEGRGGQTQRGLKSRHIQFLYVDP